eukprot:5760052-Pyramimonas_sp.AAC.1
MRRSVTCRAEACATSPHPTPPSSFGPSPMALDSCSDPWAVAHRSMSGQQDGRGRSAQWRSNQANPKAMFERAVLSL